MRVGQRIFLTPKDKALKRTMKPVIETEVCKVGRKYFWVEGYPKIKFLISNIKYPIGNNIMVELHLNNPIKKQKL